MRFAAAQLYILITATKTASLSQDVEQFDHWKETWFLLHNSITQSWKTQNEDSFGTYIAVNF